MVRVLVPLAQGCEEFRVRHKLSIYYAVHK